jgi:hypothetical protein
MNRAVLHACLPWLAVLAGSLLAAYLLVRFSGARPSLRRLRRLHENQVGGVQSLSFVLALPLFIMIMLFIVQISQLMIGIIVVHYTAYATARSASVWIPAGVAVLDGQRVVPEGQNCLSASFPDPLAPDQAMPVLDPRDDRYGPSSGGVTYLVSPGSAKYK